MAVGLALNPTDSTGRIIQKTGRLRSRRICKRKTLIWVVLVLGDRLLGGSMGRIIRVNIQGDPMKMGCSKVVKGRCWRAPLDGTELR